MVIGKQLRDLRAAKGLSQCDIERRTGLLPCYVSRIENGRTVPSVETLKKLAAACEIPLWKIFYDGKAKPKPLPLRGARRESPKDTQFLARLSQMMIDMNQRDLHLLLHMAQGMARRSRASEGKNGTAEQSPRSR